MNSDLNGQNECDDYLRDCLIVKNHATSRKDIILLNAVFQIVPN